jgi:hypothetical protein
MTKDLKNVKVQALKFLSATKTALATNGKLPDTAYVWSEKRGNELCIVESWEAASFGNGVRRSIRELDPFAILVVIEAWTQPNDFFFREHKEPIEVVFATFEHIDLPHAIAWHAVIDRQSGFPNLQPFELVADGTGQGLVLPARWLRKSIHPHGEVGTN